MARLSTIKGLMGEDSNASVYLGKNIEVLRGKKGFSQQRLAKLAGIPRTTLTNIESGGGNPSLNNLVKISSALGVGIEELLSRPRSDCQIVRADNLPIQFRGKGQVKIFKLLPDKLKGIEIDRMEIEAESGMVGYPHLSGTKEYLIVLKGEVVVTVGGEPYAIKNGDVFAFPGNQPHSYRNSKTSTSIAISVVIPIPASV
jgi:XRE family transcriptional regulator, regulator of sulfur utilization